jgi:hypothetical protein
MHQLQGNRQQSDIEIVKLEAGAVGFDKFGRGNAIAHQHGKDSICFSCILNLNPLKGATVWVHSGLPQLFWHHFTQAFKALDGVVGVSGELVSG